MQASVPLGLRHEHLDTSVGRYGSTAPTYEEDSVEDDDERAWKMSGARAECGQTLLDERGSEIVQATLADVARYGTPTLAPLVWFRRRRSSEDLR